MGFERTKGKWIIDEYNFDINEFGVKVFSISKEDKKEIRMADVYGNIANALLISKAPEMLKMLENYLSDLKNIVPQSEARDNRINNVEQLIKEATEL